MGTNIQSPVPRPFRDPTCPSEIFSSFDFVLTRWNHYSEWEESLWLWLRMGSMSCLDCSLSLLSVVFILTRSTPVGRDKWNGASSNLKCEYFETAFAAEQTQRSFKSIFHAQQFCVLEIAQDTANLCEIGLPQFSISLSLSNSPVSCASNLQPFRSYILRLA